MTDVCTTHKLFVNRADAEAWLRVVLKLAKKSRRGGKSFKRLNVFQCGDHFHVGRANEFVYRKKRKPKPPSPGQVRRKMAREDRKRRRYIDRLLRQCLRDYVRELLAE